LPFQAAPYLSQLGYLLAVIQAVHPALGAGPSAGWILGNKKMPLSCDKPPNEAAASRLRRTERHLKLQDDCQSVNIWPAITLAPTGLKTPKKNDVRKIFLLVGNCQVEIISHSASAPDLFFDASCNSENHKWGTSISGIVPPLFFCAAISWSARALLAWRWTLAENC